MQSSIHPSPISFHFYLSERVDGALARLATRLVVERIGHSLVSRVAGEVGKVQVSEALAGEGGWDPTRTIMLANISKKRKMR